MGKSVAFAYSIAGAAVAAAVIVIAGSTVGFGGSTEGSEFQSSIAIDPAAVDAMIATGEVRAEMVQTADGGLVEYVYVDAPAASGRHEDLDDDDHEDHEDHERHDDREERRSGRGDHEDDDYDD
jgi:hypothetical protein